MSCTIRFSLYMIVCLTVGLGGGHLLGFSSPDPLAGWDAPPHLGSLAVFYAVPFVLGGAISFTGMASISWLVTGICRRCPSSLFFAILAFGCYFSATTIVWQYLYPGAPIGPGASCLGHNCIDDSQMLLPTSIASLAVLLIEVRHNKRKNHITLE